MLASHPTRRAILHGARELLRRSVAVAAGGLLVAAGSGVISLGVGAQEAAAAFIRLRSRALVTPQASTAFQRGYVITVE